MEEKLPGFQATEECVPGRLAGHGTEDFKCLDPSRSDKQSPNIHTNPGVKTESNNGCLQNSGDENSNQRKIVISNLPSTVHQEYLEMFFESERKLNAGTVVKVDLNEDDQCAVVEFEEHKSVYVVLDHLPITMMGQTVDVQMYDPRSSTVMVTWSDTCETSAGYRTVEVVGPTDIICEEEEESIEMYFESKKRSAGGPTETITIKDGLAYVKFQSEEDARRVVEKKDHVLKRKSLQVKPYCPRTVIVRGPSNVICEEERELIEMYFESRNRSQGGPIECITIKENGVAYITFESEDDACRVAENTDHVLKRNPIFAALFNPSSDRENRTLEDSTYVPTTAQESYKDRVLIKGLNHTTTQDCLFNFIEAKTYFIPERLDYHANQEGVAIVTFQLGDKDLDFDKLEKVFGRSKLEGASLKVSRVPIPDCIIVSNLTPEVTRDTVEYYFENKRKSGGGPVKKVVMNDDDTCLVYFEDYTVIDKVLERQHTLGNQSLEVKRYLECLGLSEGEIAERKLRTPEDIIIHDVDSSLIRFIKISKTNQNAIKHQLKQCHANVRWPQDENGDVILNCTVTIATPDCFRIVKTWNEEALTKFQDYLKLLAVHKVPVLQDIWQRVMDELKTVCVQNPDTVGLYVERKSGFITIVGNKHVADSVSKTVEEIAKNVLEQAEEEQQRVKESVTSLKPIETRMLLADKFPALMELKFSELKVKINQNKNEILFEGMLGDVQAAKVKMYEMRQSFASATVDLESPIQASLYYLKQTKDYIIKKLKSKGVTAVWEVTDDKLKVMSSRDEELNKSLDIVQNSVIENTIALKTASMSLMNSEQWNDRVQELHAANAGMCNICVLDDCTKICVVTTDDIANEIRDNVAKFLRLNTITDNKVHCSQHVHHLFVRFYTDELFKIEKDLQSYRVQIISFEGYGGFQVRGTEDGLEKAKKRLTTLLDKVKKEEHHVEKPGLENYMQTQKGRDGLDTIELSLGCIVSLKDEKDEMYAENVGGFSGTYTGAIGHAGSVHSKAPVRKKKKNVDPNKVIFVIYALSDDIVQQAKARIDAMLHREIHEKKFADSIIKKLDENQLAEIRAIATANHLNINVNCPSGVIEVSGLASNMINASDKIHGIMRDAAAIEQQKNSAALLSNLVQWYYIEITEVGLELTKYEPDLNYKIETAYTSQAPNVKFASNDIRYVLDFRAMEEYEESNPANKLSVIRRDVVKEGTFEQPHSWDTMQGYLRVVTLQWCSQEFQDIAQKFSASVRMLVAITKIERIQNKPLWRQYISKKKQLHDLNPPNTKNETMLWHGTAAEAVDSINFFGFNRCFTNKNATAYGDGVYFAVQAAYSASDTYSRPDPSGIKSVYYSRVLTGEYTRGKQGMRVPPPKGGANAAALYDSVVDNPAAPGMYIIFHDTQAYPEYLISFKRG